MKSGGAFFEWDTDKAATNALQHGVNFEEGALAFDDPLAVDLFDEDHTTLDEQRWQKIGFAGERLLFVVYAVRDERIRIIHARPASKGMGRLYAKENQL